MRDLPQFLVLTTDGLLHGYWRADVLSADLAEHKRDGEPAVRVFTLEQDLNVQLRYNPAHEFDRFCETRLENYCVRHMQVRLPEPSAQFCADCEAELREKLGHVSVT